MRVTLGRDGSTTTDDPQWFQPSLYDDPIRRRAVNDRWWQRSKECGSRSRRGTETRTPHRRQWFTTPRPSAMT